METYWPPARLSAVWTCLSAIALVWASWSRKASSCSARLRCLLAGRPRLAPLLSNAFKVTIAPLLQNLHLDPAMLGGILAIDMGGYQMAVDLAQSPDVGRYAGILVASTLGCTISFTIPMSIRHDAKRRFRRFLPRNTDRPVRMRWPVALILGGLISGMALGTVLVQTLPTLAPSLALIAGLRFIPRRRR